jgi:signal transduction histidine kinase
MTTPGPTSASKQIYRAYLRSRWPARGRMLVVHAIAGTVVLLLLDWVFTRAQAEPPSLAHLATLRLPWALVPIAGYLVLRRAEGWRLLPNFVIALSTLWAWGSVGVYYWLGLEGSVLQAITLFATLLTTAALMPLTGRGRAGVFALIALGYVAFDLAWPHRVELGVRVADDAAVLAFAIIQVVVFQNFASSHRRSVLLRKRLERAVADLAASRVRAGDAVAEVGRMAAEVAHQVNNPLSAVKVNVRWLAREGSQPEHVAERAEVVVESLQAIDRIAGIVLDLKQRAAETGVALHLEETPR